MAHSQGRFAGLRTSFRSATSFIKHPILLTSLLIAGLVIGVRQVGGIQAWELLAYDQMMRLRPERKLDPRMLIVAITEEDIRAQNRWPISDAVIALAIRRLQAQKPRTIGLDIYRDVPHPPGHAELLNELKASNVIAITLLGNAEKEGVPAPTSVSQDRIGISDIVVDPDAVVRRSLLYAQTQTDDYYSFALRLSLHYLGQSYPFSVQPEAAIQIGKTILPSLQVNSGGYTTLDDRGYQIMLDYHSASTVARRVTLTQVLEGKVDPAWIQDKLIIIGTTAPSIKDLFVTPYNLSSDKSPGMPGVIVHAQKTSQVLSTVLDGEPLIWYWSNAAEILWIWAWAGIGGLIGWRLMHPLAVGGVSLVGLGGLAGFCYLLFLQATWVPLVPPAVAFVSAAIAMITYRTLHSALYDELTGLPNRALLVNQLQWALAHRQKLSTQQVNETPIAVLFLGLDNFKAINDSLGHRLADELLISVAKRLKACLRSNDQLARVGGDEFVILLRQIHDPDEVAHLADHLQRQVKQPFNLRGHEVVTTASVGIVLDQANERQEPEDILRDAQMAMNQAKATGKARYQVFRSGMRVQAVTRMQLEIDLRRAIERQEFQLYYQPFIHLETGKIGGFEALLRWHHPQRGLVHPVEFIPVAEETDLILPIGQWVIREACSQLKLWQTQFPDNNLIVSVNLSSKQFAQIDLVEQIEQTLEQTALEGHSLKLEITESIAMNDVESTIALLMRLKALDLSLSIDDFGTGYSSLSYLHRFPTDTIKVDRSFVSRMGDKTEDAHIVQTIIMLGHNLGMNIVAEGVETAEQLAHLRSLKCEYAQGYFFSKPVPSETAEALLQENPVW